MGPFTIEVNVTQAHIDEGERGSCSSSPIALAVIEALPVGVSFQAVSLFGVRVVQEARVVTAELPEIAFRFIGIHDRGLLVRPISFPLTFNLN